MSFILIYSSIYTKIIIIIYPQIKKDPTRNASKFDFYPLKFAI